MEKLTKKEIKAPDLFHIESAKIADWSAKHKKTIISAISALAVLGVIWSAWGMYSDTQEQKAQAELFDAQKSLKTIEADTKNQNEEKYKSTLDSLKSVAGKYENTTAGMMAALDYSRINYNFKKYDENIGLLEKMKSNGKSPVVRALIYNSLALNYTAKGDCNKAIDQWNQVEARDDMSFLHGDVFINKALCFEKLGQNDKALQMYKKAEGLAKNPEIAKLAKKFSRLTK